MNRRNINVTGLALCLLLAFIVSSCDNSVDILVPRGTSYSIYGTLNVKSKTNYIRVENLNIPLISTSKHTLNATVRIKNLKTGRTQLLTNDSIVTFNGVVTHNLKTTLPIRPSTTYEVIVNSRSSDRKVTSRVITPQLTTMKISPRHAPCGTTRTVTYKKVIPGETIIPIVVFKKKGHSTPYVYRAQVGITRYTGASGKYTVRFNLKNYLLDMFYSNSRPDSPKPPPNPHFATKSCHPPGSRSFRRYTAPDSDLER